MLYSFNFSEIYNLHSALNFFEKEFFSLDLRTMSILKSEITRITNCFVSDFDVLHTFNPTKEEENFYGLSDILEKGKIVIVPVETFVKKLKKYKNKITIIGNAAMVYNKILSKELGKSSVSLQPNLHFPKASTLALMAELIDGTSFRNIEPIYGRKSWAEEKQK